MEIIFNSNNTVNILNTTKAELEKFLRFVNGNEAKKVSETIVNVGEAEASKSVSEASKSVSEASKSVSEASTIPELAAMLGKCHQTVEYRIKKYGFKPVKVNEKGWKYYNTAEILKNFEVDPINSSKSKGAKASVLARAAKKSSTPFAQWSTEQRTKCKAKGKDVGKTFSEVFRVMSKDYGIVWDQVKKDFYATNQRSANSTVELCYFLQYEQEHNESEHYENLFENQLDKLLA